MSEKKATLSRKELIAAIAELNDISKKEAENNVDGVLETIIEALLEGNNVAIHGFGTFSVKECAERQGVNPKTGAKITIAACSKLVFKPASSLKEHIKNI